MRIQQVRLAEHGSKTIWEFRNEIEVAKHGVWVNVIAESRREYPVTIGPLWFAIVPAFPLEWIFGPGGDTTLKLSVSLAGKEYEFDPSKVVVVQGESQIEPMTVTKTPSPPQLEYDTRSSDFVRLSKVLLEYDTQNWNFVVRLRGITVRSKELTLPDLRFSRTRVWVYGMAP